MGRNPAVRPVGLAAEGERALVARCAAPRLRVGVALLTQDSGTTPPREYLTQRLQYSYGTNTSAFGYLAEVRRMLATQPEAEDVGVETVPRRWLLGAVVAVASLVTGCQPPAEPSGPAEGIVIYMDANYSGKSLPVSISAWDLGDYSGPCFPYGTVTRGSWNDCISSIRVAPGWQAVIYEDWHYGGERTTLKADVPDLGKVAGPCDGNWNDCISSILVARQ